MIRSMAEQKVKEKYESLGYKVFYEPSKSMLPFDLGNYIPDFLCIRGDEKLLIEVKGEVWRDSLEKYREIAKIVAGNAGWKFLIIQIKDSESDVALELTSDPSIQSIHKRFIRAMHAGLFDAALIYGWNILMILLRQKAEQENSAKIFTTDRNIVNALYSSGAISLYEFDRINEFMKLRNQVVHGLKFDINELIIHDLCCLVDKLNMGWGRLLDISIPIMSR